MMRYVFVIILGIHGLIHLIGFVSAFFSTSIEKQVLGVSKPIGLLWLVAFILFIISAVQYLGDKKWFYLAFLAVLLSQILIILAWKDAKLGTIVNIIIIWFVMSAFGTYRFDKMVQIETSELLNNLDTNNSSIITKTHINHLPKSVQLWLGNSGIIGKRTVSSVKLDQQGLIRTKPISKWMSFAATQYFNINNPSFVWSTKVKSVPISMVGRDKLIDGEGEMLIKLAGLLPVVNESKNEKINQGAMIRYLAELCWFPIGALNDNITWEHINSNSAKATLSIDGKSVSGIFKYTEDGRMKSFEAQRYYGGTEDSKLEKWLVETVSFKKFDGIEIPNKSKVTWKLSEGDFHWLTVEIIDLEYNVLNVY